MSKERATERERKKKSRKGFREGKLVVHVFFFSFTLHKAHPYLNYGFLNDAVIIDKMLQLLTFICSRNKQLVNICYSIQRETL